MGPDKQYFIFGGALITVQGPAPQNRRLAVVTDTPVERGSYTLQVRLLAGWPVVALLAGQRRHARLCVQQGCLGGAACCSRPAEALPRAAPPCAQVDSTEGLQVNQTVTLYMAPGNGTLANEM